MKNTVKINRLISFVHFMDFKKDTGCTDCLFQFIDLHRCNSVDSNDCVFKKLTEKEKVSDVTGCIKNVRGFSLQLIFYN